MQDPDRGASEQMSLNHASPCQQSTATAVFTKIEPCDRINSKENHPTSIEEHSLRVGFSQPDSPGYEIINIIEKEQIMAVP